jgi:hypothetical protein
MRGVSGAAAAAVAVFMVIRPSLSVAREAPPAFVATCVAVKTVTYRYDDANGNVVTNEWTDNESFGGPWRFEYDASGELKVDGKAVAVLGKNRDQILAVGLGDSGVAFNLWSYAIHVGARKIVASQVNSFSSRRSGVKTRSVEFGCDFLMMRAG